MSTAVLEFEARYTPELIDQAALVFVRQYLLRRYGRWLLLACVVNAIGLALVLWLGLRESAVFIAMLALVVLGPAYIAVVYLTYPAKLAGRLKQALLPSAHFALSIKEVHVRTSAGAVQVSWPRAGSFLEQPSFSLLALSPLAFLIFPTASLPHEAREFLRRQASARVA